MSQSVENLPFIAHNSQPVKRLPLYPDEPTTLAELFSKATKESPRKDALNYKRDGEWRSISSEEMISRLKNIALGLYSIGIRKGDRVAILSDNSPEWTLTDAGCQFSGIIDVPIYTTLTPNSVEYIINDAGARIFFLQNQKAFERLQQNLADCPTIEKFVFFDFTNVTADNAISLTELEKLGARLGSENPDLVDELRQAVNPGDVATLIYTSGTTGEPKGVMLTHSNLISNVIDAGENHEFKKDDVPLSVLPLSHVYERTGMYLYIFHAMSVYYAESIDKVADNLREVRPTIFVGVPRIFEKVYQKAKLKSSQESRLKEKIFDWAIEVGKEYAYKTNHHQPVSFFLGVKHNIADRLVFSKFRQFFGGRLRACVTGGAALSNEIFYIFMGAGVRILQGYGLTETSPVITSSTPLHTRAGTVGKPIRNVKIRIAEDGEIEAFGPNVMLGYYNKPEATRETFTADGWFKTGDIGEIDSDGFLKITDRKKELFKTSGGKYIAPAVIEQMIKACRFVNQVVLIGNERKFPAALIVPDFEQLEAYAKAEGINTKSPAELCRHPKIISFFESQVNELTQELAKYEKVKKIALLDEELTVEGGEMTPTLKIKRRVVNEKYHDVIEKIYVDAEKKA